MPHIIIEHSANVAEQIDIDALVAAVHEAALTTGLVPPDGLRTRAASRDHYRVADGDPSFGFVAIVIRLGPGRTDDQKSVLLGAITDVADRIVIEAGDALAVMLSAEIQEIDAVQRINRNHVRERLVRGPSDQK